MFSPLMRGPRPGFPARSDSLPGRSRFLHGAACAVIARLRPEAHHRIFTVRPGGPPFRTGRDHRPGARSASDPLSRMSPTLEIPFRFRRPDLSRLRLPDRLSRFRPPDRFRRVSPRHVLAGLTALVLLAVPAAAAVRSAPAAAPEPVVPDSVAGAETVEYRVEQGGVAVSASYPAVPGAP